MHRTEPVFSFRTRVGIVEKRLLQPGRASSYGRTRRLSRDFDGGRILCAGYGDGIPRSVSNKASVLIRGVRCPVLGRVTMDQTVVDVTGVKGVSSGDEVVLVGRQAGDEISVVEFSRWADTIPRRRRCARHEARPQGLQDRAGNLTRRHFPMPDVRKPISLSFCRSRMLRPSKMKAGLDITP